MDNDLLNKVKYFRLQVLFSVILKGALYPNLRSLFFKINFDLGFRVL